MGHGFPEFLVPFMELIWPLIQIWCALAWLLGG